MRTVNRFAVMKPNLLAPACLTVLLFAAAGCQTTKAPDRFAQADADKSGALSRDEVNTYLVTHVFESRDADRDGRLTKAEWLVGDDAGQEKLFLERDANNDGVVTLEEALAYGKIKGASRQFVRAADTNKDGLLSREEVTAYYGSKEGAPN
jgi:Ca2+-binding EF-hand superfamily protein